MDAESVPSSLIIAIILKMLTKKKIPQKKPLDRYRSFSTLSSPAVIVSWFYVKRRASQRISDCLLYGCIIKFLHNNFFLSFPVRLKGRMGWKWQWRRQKQFTFFCNLLQVFGVFFHWKLSIYPLEFKHRCLEILGFLLKL